MNEPLPRQMLIRKANLYAMSQRGVPDWLKEHWHALAVQRLNPRPAIEVR